MQNQQPLSVFQRFSVSVFVLAALMVCGCASAPKKLGSNRVAAVLIKGASAETIKSSAEAVFTKNGFEPGGDEEKDLVFEKKATAMNAFFYGDWYSGTVWARARLFMTPRPGNETLLDCDIYMVQDPDDPLFQKERKVNARKGELQKLLDEVKTDAETHARK